MTRIILADDHLIIRDGLRALLELEDDFEIVAEAGTGRDTMDVCRKHKPDVLILDLDMPEIDGLDVTKALQTELPDMKIIVLTMYGTEEYAVRLLSSGASGFVPKSQSAHQLPDIIRNVLAGQTFLPEDLKDTVLNTMLASGGRKSSNLSDRELQVFSAYARGKERSEIADMLGVSPRTVETHKRRIMQKLNAKSMADLIKIAIREGIIKSY